MDIFVKDLLNNLNESNFINYDKILLKNCQVVLNSELVNDKENEVVFEITPNSHMSNYYQTIHGGCISTLTDSLTSFLPCYKNSYKHVTIELSVTFIKGIPNNKNFYCLCKLNKFGKKIIFMESIFYDNDKKICSTGKHTKIKIK